MKWLLSSLGISGVSAGWFTAAALLALIMAGGSGMYFGYEIASARADERIQVLKDAQIDALTAKNDQLLAEQRRANEIASRFEATLKGIRIENKTFNNEVRVEREKLVYTDCVVPDSGVDLLNRHIDAANLRLLGKAK